MKKDFIISCLILLFLSSCKFSCSVGDREDPKSVSVVQNNARIYNGIQLQADGITLTKAFLTFENGERVPDNNYVDFKSPVQIHLQTDSGWVVDNGKVFPGASETITAENGTVILKEDDLFAKYTEGVAPADARAIYLSAIIHLKENAPPTSFIVSFHVWDKKGKGFVQGSYKLYSK
jgi:hypothetical protein